MTDIQALRDIEGKLVDATGTAPLPREGLGGLAVWEWSPKYTASLDACKALQGELLPGWVRNSEDRGDARAPTTIATKTTIWLSLPTNQNTTLGS